MRWSLAKLAALAGGMCSSQPLRQLIQLAQTGAQKPATGLIKACAGIRPSQPHGKHPAEPNQDQAQSPPPTCGRWPASLMHPGCLPERRQAHHSVGAHKHQLKFGRLAQHGRRGLSRALGSASRPQASRLLPLPCSPARSASSIECAGVGLAWSFRLCSECVGLTFRMCCARDSSLWPRAGLL